MALAVALSAFMLFSVFTVGITYFKMYRLQNIRLSGGDFDAIMYGMTKEQKEKCEDNPDIDKIGIAAVAGSVLSTDYDNTANVGCVWLDEVYWNDIMTPAREWVKGSYPQEENEIMVTKEALESCGFEELGLGIAIPSGLSGRMHRETRASGNLRFPASGKAMGRKMYFMCPEPFMISAAMSFQRWLPTVIL